MRLGAATEVEAVLFSHPAVHQAAVFGVASRVMGELVGAAVTLRPEAAAEVSRLSGGTSGGSWLWRQECILSQVTSLSTQGITPRDLLDWCGARLAHYKVPSTVHILANMPTTGSGKILKTELRAMFGGGAASSTVWEERPAAGGPTPAAVTLAEAAAVLAAACGGELRCQALDAGLGVEWGRELLPDLGYLLVVEKAADISQQVGCGGSDVIELAALPELGPSAWCPWLQVELAICVKGLRHIAVLCFEQPAPRHLSTLLLSDAPLLVLHVARDACAFGADRAAQLQAALAAAQELLPPLGGVLHVPMAHGLALAAAGGAAMVAGTTSVPQPAAPSAAKTAPGVGAMQRAILAAIGSLLGEQAARSIGGDEPLMSAGLTSTLAVQLTQQLEASVGIELPGTLVFDYPSVNEMAAFLADAVAGPDVPPAPTPPAAAQQPWFAAPRPAVHASAPAASPAAVASTNASAAAGGAALVLQQVAQLLGGPAPAACTPLMSAGLTSTLAVQLTQQLEEVVGVELPGTLVFDYPTAAEIGGFLAAEGLLRTQARAAAHPLATTAGAVSPKGQLAAVIGLVVREAAQLLGDDAQLTADTPLMAAGLTSALAVQLVTALEGAVGAELPGTLVFDYPSGERAAHNPPVVQCTVCFAWHLTTSCMHPLHAASEIAQVLTAEGLLPADVAVPHSALPLVGADQASANATRPLHVITSSAHSVPGGELSYHSMLGNDRIGVVPLERWEVDAAPPDNPTGKICMHRCSPGLRHTGRCWCCRPPPWRYAACRAEPAVWCICGCRRAV